MDLIWLLIWLLSLGLCTRLAYMLLDRVIPALPPGAGRWLPLNGKWLRKLLVGIVSLLFGLMLMPAGYECRNPGGCTVFFGFHVVSWAAWLGLEWTLRQLFGG